jgi:hypothetical protein
MRGNRILNAEVAFFSFYVMRRLMIEKHQKYALASPRTRVLDQKELRVRSG